MINLFISVRNIKWIIKIVFYGMSMGDIKVNINICIVIKFDMRMYRYFLYYNFKFYN